MKPKYYAGQILKHDSLWDGHTYLVKIAMVRIKNNELYYVVIDNDSIWSYTEAGIDILYEVTYPLDNLMLGLTHD
jgi:hypothetical protein